MTANIARNQVDAHPERNRAQAAAADCAAIGEAYGAVALAIERYSRWADEPLSEESIAAEVDAVRRAGRRWIERSAAHDKRSRGV